MYCLLSSLIILLALFDSNNGQQLPYSQQWVTPGIKYAIRSVGYPLSYPAGWAYKWIAVSDRRMRFTCQFLNVPHSPGCAYDRLLIEDGNALGKLYCGGSAFSILSNTNQLTISALISERSPGGSFSCTIETEAVPSTPSCECGRRNPTRIHGGEVTGVNEYPMMAAVIDVMKRIVICGSTIISVKQVLTAAHCVHGRYANLTGVLVGEHDMTTGEETAATVLMRVKSFTVHDQYPRNIKDYDIALITVEGSITFSESVGPICLPFLRRDSLFYRDSVDVMGWGATDHGRGPANILMKASLGVITADECRPTFPSLTARQICTREPNRDSCTFDSGGPLIIQSGSTRRVVQVGIVSRGSACGFGEAALNTRVGAFIQWILDNTFDGISYCQVE